MIKILNSAHKATEDSNATTESSVFLCLYPPGRVDGSGISGIINFVEQVEILKGNIMKKAGILLAISSILAVLAGCQQSEQKQTSDISRKDRLIANENLGLRDELAQCRKEIENQKNLVEQCRQEKETIQQQAGETAKWLMDELPADLLKEVETLTKENERLSRELEELQEASRPADANQR
ncbi:MAG: hypothetical protein PHP01_01400 [Phycisphaerae bacterium]|nr:hypothetical protein [Phycisphaerae bacterium]